MARLPPEAWPQEPWPVLASSRCWKAPPSFSMAIRHTADRQRYAGLISMH